MENILIKNKYLIIVLLLVAGLFYWFEVRPANIRKICNEDTKNKVSAALKAGKQYSTSLANGWYRLCLVDKGMKAEDLLKE